MVAQDQSERQPSVLEPSDWSPKRCGYHKHNDNITLGLPRSDPLCRLADAAVLRRPLWRRVAGTVYAVQ